MIQIIVHGRLTKDPEQRDYTNKNGNGKMTTFTVAADQRWGDTTNYFDCSAFGKTGELVAAHFHKGQEIIVRGEMNSRKIEKDGVKRVYWTINVDEFDFCGSKQTADSMEQLEEDSPF